MKLQWGAHDCAVRELQIVDASKSTVPSKIAYVGLPGLGSSQPANTTLGRALSRWDFRVAAQPFPFTMDQARSWPFRSC